MNTHHHPTGLSTTELARSIGLAPDSIRVHLCKRGSYFGLVPGRLPNGRLIWPADSLERLKARAEQMPPRPVPSRNAAGGA